MGSVQTGQELVYPISPGLSTFFGEILGEAIFLHCLRGNLNPSIFSDNRFSKDKFSALIHLRHRRRLLNSCLLYTSDAADEL